MEPQINSRSEPRRRRHALLGRAATSLIVVSGPGKAHEFGLCPLRIDHPYALPTRSDSANGTAYLRGIRNTGNEADRRVGARTLAARVIEIHRSGVDAQKLMRMRAIKGMPPKAELKLRRGGDDHLMLIGLRQPLKNGDRFPMTLRFERAGERDVMVWVQLPRSAAPVHSH